MKMDVSKFKKVSSDEKKTVFKHPRGHLIEVAHAPLTPGYRKKLKDLPAYAEGGEVAPGEKSQSFQDYIDNFVNGANRQASAVSDLASGKINQANQIANQESSLAFAQPPQAIPGPAPASLEAPNLQAAAAAPAPQAAMGAADPFGYGQMAKGMMGGINTEMAGAKDFAKAAEQEGQAQMLAAKAQQADTEALMKSHKAEYDKLSAERQALINDFKQGHINPNHYMDSRTGMQKVATIIGLMLGGAQAQQFVEKQIENDINAQKAEIGKKENLLSFNMQQFGNLKDATAMTRIQLNDLYAAKVAQAAAQSMGPKAKAQAQMFIGQKMMESAQLQAELSKRTALLGGMKNGTLSPEQVITHLVPQHDQKAAREELVTVQGYNQASKEISSLFNGIKGIGGISGNMPLTESKAKMQATRAQIVQAIRSNMKGQGALSDQEQKTAIEPLLPNATDTIPQLRQKEIGIQNILSNKVQGGTPTLAGYGIKIPQARFDPQEGMTASNAKGERIIKRNGQWVPYGR